MILRTLKALGAVLALFTVVFFTYIYLKSPNYKISREIEVSAKPEAIFPHLNNSKNMHLWMPWQEKFPDLKMEFSGPKLALAHGLHGPQKGPWVLAIL